MQQTIIETLALTSPLLEKLRRIKKPPETLYFVGENPAELLRNPSVAIVGTRKMSPYGRAVTEKLATELARAGVVIISGNALGVDVTAQKAALDAGGSVITVVPSGLEKIYPATNALVAEQIVKQGGAIVSEFDASHSPRRDEFLQRNRIIAGFCDVVVVIEAAERSGSLNTALHARNANIPIFAVPGPITNSLSRGTNKLIKDGAYIITDTSDVLDFLQIKPLNQQVSLIGENDLETRILELITEGMGDGTLLADKLGVSMIELQTALTMLEINGRVKQNSIGFWLVN